MKLIPIIDQTRKDEADGSKYGEAVRLSNEVRPIIANTIPITDFLGKVIGWELPKWGLHPETAPYSDFVLWLNDGTIKKSPSLFWFMLRCMAWRFPEKHTEIRMNLSENRKVEFDFILSQLKQEVEWLGGTGHQNMVELNPESPLNKTNVRINKLSNDRVKITGK